MRASDRPEAERLALVTQLPAVAYTRGGARFYPRSNPWKCQDGPFKLHIDIQRVPAGFRVLVPALQHTLLTFIQGYSARYAQNLFESYLHFAKLIDKSQAICTSINLHQVQQYGSRLLAHEAYRIGTLNVLLQKWFSLGHPGVDEACIQHLRERRKPGNEKGNFVRTHHPVQGPLSHLEYTLVYKALDAAYGEGKLDQWAFVLGRLLFATGQRISQYASMKVLDFSVTVEKKDGRRAYSVEVPLVKKKLQHARESFITFDLTPQTGALLFDYINELRALGFDDNSALFPADMLFQVAPVDAGQGVFKGHCTAAGLSQKFKKAVSPFAPPTERLDYAPTPVAPRRFRYTFGTRMAEEGYSKVVLANRLGHGDLQNVHVYYEASPKIVDNIDAALGPYLAPVAQAFRGRLIEDEKSSTFKGASGTRIIDFRTSKSGLGSCGKDGSCGFDKPVACYMCFKYEPWLDGPHEKVLQRLLNERESFVADPQIARIRDDTILAIREVISECNAVRAQQTAEGQL